MMKKIALAILLCMPLGMQAQSVVNDAKQKAELAKKAAEEAARIAEEARIAALKAEEAAKAAEEAAKAEAKAKAKAKAEEAAKEAKAKEAAKEAKAKLEESTTNKWEVSNNERAVKALTESAAAAAPNPDAKYLEGAVPEVNGQVEWRLSIDVPGKSAEWIYDKLGQLFTDMTHAEGQMEQSRVALADEATHTLGVRFQEWLVFRNSTLSLDRTEFNFTIIAECTNEHADVKLGRINYVYEENRDGGMTAKAEEWITDKYGLNKSKTKLARLSGKFRRKTIDRKDYIFREIKNTLLLED
ncbi:MAG: DUF4468 domain-containing protein [Prevotella sp.]|nr:DUF4468 domain-containing protein [Prevotella sp.]